MSALKTSQFCVMRMYICPKHVVFTTKGIARSPDGPLSALGFLDEPHRSIHILVRLFIP